MEEFKKALFAQGDEGVFGFRIPSILALASGRVLAFCEARRDSLGDSGRIDIVMRPGDGVSFGPVRTVVSGGNDTVGNPCPVQDPATGRVFLLYNRNEADRPEPMILRGDGPRTVHVVYSDDEGETWSPPRDI
ncbi:MAG: exo-alpha-sialidase, partial [Clostridia bacterium]|nr:exo-alpha-sialidase [Clostridia bacterium]